MEEKELLPYWNNDIEKKAKDLWLPAKESLLGLKGVKNPKNILQETTSDCWFSKRLNLKEELKQIPKFSSVVCSKTGAKIKVTRSRKIRLYPTAPQRQILREWFGTARYVYNQTVSFLRQPETKASWITIKKGILDALPGWSKDKPFQIKSIAVKDACTAVKNAKLKCKKTGMAQKVKFKSRKERNESIYIPKSAVKEDSFYRTKMGKIFFTEEIGEVSYDCRVVYQNGRYFLIKPEDKEVLSPDSQRNGIVALDPGCRTFQTFYTPNACGKIGYGDFGRIHRLCKHLDNFISRMTKAKSRQKQRFRKAIERMRFQIKDLISEIHHKTANFLCKTFDYIVIPPFESSQMVKKAHRKIRSKSVRAMLTWAHYRFKQILLSKAEILSCKVVIQCEAYTSRTCSSCGYVEHNIGGRKLFKCKQCHKIIDRDYNGARGLYLRALGDNPSLESYLACIR